jgi:DHA1 family inner membrane transport protein
MLGNFVVGTSIMAPAAMLNELASGLHVGIGQANLLLTLGAVVLCLGSPLLSWATSRIDRRQLLAGSLSIIMIAQAAAALTSSFSALLVLRLVMLAAAAPFTPQAVGIVGIMACPERRARTISYVFLGWSLAGAVGLPMMTVIASRAGWQFAVATIAAIAMTVLILVVWRLPNGLRTPPVDIAS